ncbi:Hypothetical protein, putative [Bodo saltans]|uniref:JmjC domain-containing protein n=1 Tax=Bodo saltans TaxID=75058 RepID=A0A0S4KKB2_BODSA|nr:Hypothetical protein, putative [Bodo saltans]|eukprot:CUI14067.1 Hypothetical protein, putative [Bodo saltans]
MHTRVTSLGILSRLKDKTLFKLLSFLDAPDLLALSSVSWALFVACNAEELWRALVLLYLVEDKIARFSFHISWKETYRSPTVPRSCQGARIIPALVSPFSSLINCWSRKNKAWLLPPPYACYEVKPSFLFYNVKGLNLAQLPMNLSGIERCGPLSRSEFVERFEKPNCPVIITGLMNSWRAMERWRLSSLLSSSPNLLLKTNGRSTNGKRFRMKLCDFVSYCEGWNGEKPLYIFDKKILGNTNLVDDYCVPEIFSEDLFDLMEDDDRPDYKWLLFGPNGSGSPFHTDPHDSSAWNAVIEGCKRVSFYPPWVIPPGVDEEEIHSEYYASEDTMEWYRSIYPTLSPEKQPIECLVQPGEILFIPSGWWHQVQNIGHTIAVTQNFCSRITFPRVARHMNAHAGKTVRKDFKIALSESENYQHLAAEIVVNRKHNR